MSSAAAQDTPSQTEEAAAEGALRVFLDCSGRACERDFYRREIPYVNYTRDRNDAQVHLLITSEGTGGGGRQFTLDFIGREQFEGMDDQLVVNTPANMAEERLLTLVARNVALGLARYIARTPLGRRLRIAVEGEAADVEQAADPEDDPWNFWSFEVGANSFYSGEDRQDFLRLELELEAERITEGLKLEFGANASYSEDNFETDSVTTVTSVRRSYDGGGLAVWTLGAHTGIGGLFRASHSSFSNEELTVRIAPAFEYNLFPYEDSNRRQLRFLYSIGLTYLNYDDLTIFQKLEETVPDHRLGVGLEVRQPWGSSRASFQVVQHLNDLSRHRLRLDGGIDIRLFRGLSVEFEVGASRVRDQINVRAGDATEEEILTSQRELLTGFEYDFEFGFNYRFGSIFSNVVNPRIGGRNLFFLRGF